MNGSSSTVSGLSRFAGSPPGLLGSSMSTGEDVVNAGLVTDFLAQPVVMPTATPKARNPNNHRLLPPLIMPHLENDLGKLFTVRNGASSGHYKRRAERVQPFF